MIATMKRARTPIHNARTPTNLVERGPFRFTRNPMYVFGSTWYAGLALLLVQPWSLALLPAVVAITHYGVVLKEEEYLERRFGDAYRQYKARVRRYW
jgi:protein-S-isoprenylcysteine O-methyltransferase Ste14